MSSQVINAGQTNAMKTYPVPPSKASLGLYYLCFVVLMCLELVFITGMPNLKSNLYNVYFLQVLDEEAEVFIVKMWRLLIYETEAKKIGLVK